MHFYNTHRSRDVLSTGEVWLEGRHASMTNRAGSLYTSGAERTRVCPAWGE